MANDARPVRLGKNWPSSEPTLAQIMDPVAIEQRLKEARARRAVALQQRSHENPAPRPPVPGVTPLPFAPLLPAAAAGEMVPDRLAWTAAPVTPTNLGAPPEAARSPDPVIVLPEPVATAPGLPDAAGHLAPAMPEPAEPPLAVPAFLATTEAEASPAAERATPARLIAGVPLWLTFVAGLGLGATAVAVVLIQRPDAPVAVPETVAAAPAQPPAATPSALPPTQLSSAPLPVVAEPAVPARSVGAAPGPVTLEIAAPSTSPQPALSEPAVETATAPSAALASATLAPTLPPLVPPTAAAPAPEASPPAPDAATPVAPPALPARVTVHYPRSSGTEATAAADMLRTAGIADVQLVPVGFSIARTNVRFYHAQDQQAADTVTGLLPAPTDREPPLARDFTTYATPTATGRLEVWLAGTSDGSVATAPRQAAVTAPRPPASTPTRAFAAPAPEIRGTPQDQAEAVARILVERAYDRLLRQAPSP